mmetsp:Transcript_22923/g.27031  ORF Transcript_22923/g.27031 Transcript_22923/m.27031 type:complete len:95 (+) Transcript_22923:16-300(+)
MPSNSSSSDEQRTRIPGGCGSEGSPFREVPTLKDGSEATFQGNRQQRLSKMPWPQLQQLPGPTRRSLLPYVNLDKSQELSNALPHAPYLRPETD